MNADKLTSVFPMSKQHKRVASPVSPLGRLNSTDLTDFGEEIQKINLQRVGSFAIIHFQKYMNKSSYFLIPLSLLVASFVHSQSVTGLIFFIFLFVFLKITRVTLERRWVFLVFFVSLLVITQLVFLFIGLLDKYFHLIETFDRKNEFLAWLGVIIPDPKILISDFIALNLLVLYYIDLNHGIRSTRKTPILTIALPEKTQSIRLHVMNSIRLNAEMKRRLSRRFSFNTLRSNLDFSYVSEVVEKKLAQISKRNSLNPVSNIIQGGGGGGNKRKSIVTPLDMTTGKSMFNAVTKSPSGRSAGISFPLTISFISY